MKTTNHIRRTRESNILQSCSGEARGIAFGAEHDYLEIVIFHDRQPRVGGWVEPPLEHVTLDNQRVGNSSLDRALAFWTNIDE